MNVAVLGTGSVGKTIGTKLVECGYEVMMGSRQLDNSEMVLWAKEHSARGGTFSDAAAFGELVFNCTAGAGSIEALEAAEAKNLAGKVLVDVANPLDYSHGMPPSLGVCNTDSLGEQIQAKFSEARVVKALNTMNVDIMVNPRLIPGDHVVFICGNDAEAKRQTQALLSEFGWGDKQFLDLGDITSARGTEAYLLLWLRLYGAVGTGYFNLQIVTE